MIKEQEQNAKELKAKREKENAERKEKGLPLVEEEEAAQEKEKLKKKAEKGLKKTSGDKEFMDAGKTPSGLHGKGELGGEVMKIGRKNKFASA